MRYPTAWRSGAAKHGAGSFQRPPALPTPEPTPVRPPKPANDNWRPPGFNNDNHKGGGFRIDYGKVGQMAKRFSRWHPLIGRAINVWDAIEALRDWGWRVNDPGWIQNCVIQHMDGAPTGVFYCQAAAFFDPNVVFARPAPWWDGSQWVVSYVKNPRPTNIPGIWQHDDASNWVHPGTQAEPVPVPGFRIFPRIGISPSSRPGVVTDPFWWPIGVPRPVFNPRPQRDRDAEKTPPRQRPEGDDAGYRVPSDDPLSDFYVPGFGRVPLGRIIDDGATAVDVTPGRNGVSRPRPVRPIGRARPPARGRAREKERKSKLRGASALRVLSKVWEDTKFGRDLMEAWYDALPKEYRSKKHSAFDKAVTVWKHWDKADRDKAYSGMLREIIEEKVGGAYDAARGDLAKKMGRFKFGVGPPKFPQLPPWFT